MSVDIVRTVQVKSHVSEPKCSLSQLRHTIAGHQKHTTTIHGLISSKRLAYTRTMQCIVGSLYAVYTAASRTGSKLLPELEIAVWHCP